MITLTHDDYTVGWICALSLELAASMTMLDDKHEPLAAKSGDNNSYILGSIGPHNIVMACLPTAQYGTTSAAVVASDMRRSFPKLRIRLMVGIGGGVPSHDVPGDQVDIRLGDVVVGKPGLQNGGVVQYDFGKVVAGGEFEQTGRLDGPPSILSNALATLQAQHLLNASSFAKYLEGIPAQFESPGPNKDHLYICDYDHVGGDTCDRCDGDKLVKREPLQRTSSLPVVHYGTIASGNSVMKDGRTRERLRQKFEISCFEMEAAGLMNHFQCVVIRGICDYCDSHKNKIWQPYAAAVAAAYAKQLLGVLHPDEVVDTKPGVVAESSSLYVLFPRLVPSARVELGRLCIDAQAPWDDFCSVSPGLTDDDVMIMPSSRLRQLTENQGRSTFFDKLRTAFSASHGGVSLQGLVTSFEKMYFLLNSGNIFRQLCVHVDAKLWLQTVIKEDWKAYMVVAKHTIPEPSGNGELLVAVQYRRVGFKWFSNKKVESAFLEKCSHRWKVLEFNTGRSSKEEDEIVEADLEETFGETAVTEGQLENVFISDDQVFMVSES